MEYIEEQIFDHQDFREKGFPLAEYEDCLFTGCNWSSASLAGSVFIDCRFENCDLSSVRLDGTTLRDVEFKDCKLLGMRFDLCNSFLISFSFDTCILDFSSFRGLEITKTIFRDCRLEEVDFIGANLTAAVFADCDLQGALFHGTTLVRADLSSAFYFSIDPDANVMKKAKFSIMGLDGLLGKYDLDIE